MTRYFYDTEFLDDGVTIDMISIGIACEDGREYYAVNLDADWAEVRKHDWLTENVVGQLPPSIEWKPKSQIAEEVKNFLLPEGSVEFPELWAWFSAYDHVVLSQLFGRMLDLPPGIPMYTHDLRAFVDYLPSQRRRLPSQLSGHHDALEDARHLKSLFEFIANTIEENALELSIYR